MQKTGSETFVGGLHSIWVTISASLSIAEVRVVIALEAGALARRRSEPAGVEDSLLTARRKDVDELAAVGEPMKWMRSGNP